MNMKRPKLNKIPMPENLFAPGQFLITMSPGQWDMLLEVAYEDGAILLEVDVVKGMEKVVGAYCKDVKQKDKVD